uniref:Uncharacterized protein n=1 Tax=Arundo donax TaxID=35708 RepID=A0A0A9BJN9_ARUDO
MVSSTQLKQCMPRLPRLSWKQIRSVHWRRFL